MAITLQETDSLIVNPGRVYSLGGVLAIYICAFFFGATSPANADQPEFDRDIAPLLSRRCLSCHQGDDAEGNLNLSSKESTLAGGENGPAWVPGSLPKSLLWKRVAAGEMPEDEPLPDVERDLLKRWIESGAGWGTDPIDPFLASTKSRAGYDWWSLQPLVEQKLPTVKNLNWTRNAIDRFVLAKLEDAQLTPSAEAASHLLMRRVYFDLTGLPPGSDLRFDFSVEPGSYEVLIDQLLASPHLGQRWARHWLDVVRFGESHGFEYNQPRNNSWWFRNWVIEAFNSDLPYDEFVRQQIAGDVIYPDDTFAWAATGFIVAGPHNTTKPSSQKMRATMRHDELEDIVGAIGQSFLGLTINCARCHDHKFDPISQQEYYQLVAAVVGVDHGEREIPDEKAAAAKRELKAIRQELEFAREKRKSLETKTEGKAATSAAGPSTNLESLREEIKQLAKKEKQLAAIRMPKMYMAISSQPSKVSRLRRGDVTSPAELVKPAGLQAINSSLADFQLDEHTSDSTRRIKLAEWISGNQNPVLARVIVNRLWHYHFGQGLVRSPSDFGFNGDRPSHPELLDYLAGELMRNNWNLKPIHRLILTSATYRQGSRMRYDAAKTDAANRLLWRMAPRRLTAEEIRDSILRIAGKLDDRHGGPGYRDVREYKYKGSHYYDPIEPTGRDAVRRTVYRFSPRGAKRTFLDTFDCPDPSAKAPKREVTTTPLQALSLMNNGLVLQLSKELASVLKSRYPSNQGRIHQLYRLAFAREPDAEEVTLTTRFIEENDLASLCRVLFNSNEFLYVR